MAWWAGWSWRGYRRLSSPLCGWAAQFMRPRRASGRGGVSKTSRPGNSAAHTRRSGPGTDPAPPETARGGDRRHSREGPGIERGCVGNNLIQPGETKDIADGQKGGQP
jgi:hypothetical protein